MTESRDPQLLMQDFARDGMLELPGLLNAKAASAVYDAIMETRRFDESLFFSKAQWDAGDKSHKHTNPSPGRNIVEKLGSKLDFLESDKSFHDILTALLGQDFRWLARKIVCRLPQDILPAWVREQIAGKPANTLNAFMHPEYRDISYFLENDLHQDIQDYPRFSPEYREHRLISLYVHTEEIGPQDAPVYLMPGTHRFGATVYQHDVSKLSDHDWLYNDGRGHSIHTQLRPVTGGPGHIAMWHSCLVHGARPVKHSKPRLVIRYMLARSLTDLQPCGLDKTNEQIEGPLFLTEDFTGGQNANHDGSWNLRETDFTRLVS